MTILRLVAAVACSGTLSAAMHHMAHGAGKGRGKCDGKRGDFFVRLAPPGWLLKANDPELFDREYHKLLDSLDTKQVAEELGPNAILLCWESFNVRCHQRLVAEWLEEKCGIVVPELDHARAESIPFSEQPSKWDGKPKLPAQLIILF